MKELILLVKTNYKSSFFYIFLIGIFLIPFQKSIELIYPNFFFGKFQDLETINITFSNFFIIVGSTGHILLSSIKNNTNAKNYNKFVILLFIYLILVSLLQFNHFTIFISTGLLTYLTLCLANTKKRNEIYNTFVNSILIQLFISLYQITFQKNSEIKLLSYLGEPQITNQTKGISKIRYNDFEILRGYGTTLNPNFNSILFYLAILISKTKSKKILFFIGNLTTISITGITASILYLINIYNKSKKIIILFLITLLSIISIRITDIKYESLSERIKLITTFISNYSNNFNISNFLFGDKNYLLSNSTLKTLPWDYLPVHNLFLIIFQTFGIIGLILLIILFYKLFKKNKLQTIILFIIANLDHYLLTNPAGMTILALIVFLIIHSKNQDFQENKHKDPSLL